MSPPTLSGVSILVAGAGLAGLAAARDLVAAGATVTVAEARDRVGGRVWTIRDGFAGGQHAEAGADMIDAEHTEVIRLCREFGLKLTPILRGGFGFVQPDTRGRPRIVPRGVTKGWARLERTLADLVARYQLAEQRWDSPIAADLARRSVAGWLDAIGADAELRGTVVGLRGFFLADPEELSLLALVDQFASDTGPGGRMYRIEGGNGLLPERLAAPLGDALHLGTELVAVSHRGRGVRASLKRGRQVSHVQVDYLVFALPATVLKRIPITPVLPSRQHDALVTLKYGQATKTLLQFSRRFWRAPGRPRAFGSSLPWGAVWDGNEEQNGNSGILTLLAGGSASVDATERAARDGAASLAIDLDWLGAGDAQVIAARQIGWDSDPWARGGYAYFDPGFDPALRSLIAQPCGPLFFAGEHTSLRWQGYMNGAVESGRRAAAEVEATHRMRK
jgi:monoamine oxidase